MKNSKTNRTGIIIIAIVASLVLYFSGVYSGLYAKNVIEKNTKEELGFMKEYVDLLEKSLENIQFEQAFLGTLEGDSACKLTTITMKNLVSQLGEYWSRFPLRIEEYEKNSDISEQYIELKKDYTRLSLRTWIAAKDNYDRCRSGPVPILYFYSKDCEICTKQGEELDLMKFTLRSMGKNAIVFTIDIDEENTMIGLLKEYYAIKSTPAIIINEEVLQGRLYDSTEIINFIDTTRPSDILNT